MSFLDQLFDAVHFVSSRRGIDSLAIRSIDYRAGKLTVKTARLPAIKRAELAVSLRLHHDVPTWLAVSVIDEESSDE